MGVPCDVLEDLLRSAERWLGVDDPVLAVESIAQSGKAPGIGQRAVARLISELEGDATEPVLDRLTPALIGRATTAAG